jgi:competence protein ComEC
MRNILAALLAAQHDRFVLFLPVFFGTGILLYFSRATEPSLAWALGAAIAAVLAAVGCWRWQVTRYAALCAVFCSAGFATACLAASLAPGWAPLPRHACLVTGRITSLDVLPDGRRVTLGSPSLDGRPALRRALRLRLRDTDAQPLAAGDDIRVRALLEPPAPPDYPGGRDTQREAYFAGIAGYGFAIGPVLLLHEARGGAVLAAWRERIAGRIMLAVPGSPGAIAATLLTGIGTAIPAADRQAYAASGLAHLLAVAGLHIGIVMGLVFGGVRLALAAWERAALLWPIREIAAIASLCAGACYLELTGAHLPIERSFAMAALAVLALLTGRRALSLRSLALAALALMAVSPEAIIGVSFQMSFAAVLCLIAGYEMVRPWRLRAADQGPRRKLFLYVTGLALTSALAGTASLPFAIYHFGQASLYYVPANMLAVPLTAFWVMPWGLAALALMPFGLETLALTPMGLGIRGLTAMAHAVAPPWCLALVAAGMALAGLLRGPARVIGLPLLGLGLMAPWLLAQPDILVGPAGTFWALRIDGQIRFEASTKISAYALQAPARLWGGLQSAGFDVPADGLSCAAAGCLVRLNGQTALFVRDPGHVGCAATLLVASAWLHDPCPGVPAIDHAFVQREGATSITMDRAGPVLITDHGIRGDRPWVISAKPALPMALTE